MDHMVHWCNIRVSFVSLPDFSNTIAEGVSDNGKVLEVEVTLDQLKRVTGLLKFL